MHLLYHSIFSSKHFFFSPFHSYSYSYSYKKYSNNNASFFIIVHQYDVYIMFLYTIATGNVIMEHEIKSSKECIQLYRVCDVRDTCCQGVYQMVSRSQLCWIPPWG